MSNGNGREIRAAALASAILVVVVMCLFIDSAEALADSEIASEGSGGGQVLAPGALALDASSGALYAADSGNRRVDALSDSGEFLAFGWGVVASGPDNAPQNEVEKVEVLASGGSFRLLFIQNSEKTIGDIKQKTGVIPFNATAAAVQSALEGLAAISPGDVTVTGPAGGPWTIEFTGAYADTDVHGLEEDGSSELSGGAGELKISTTQGGAAYEVCKAPADVCRAGQRGSLAGQLNPESVAVDPTTGDLYVFDGLETSSYNEAPNLRVQKFTSDGTFIYMLGGGVNLDAGEDICTAASGDVCGRGAKGSGAGEFDSADSSVAVGSDGVLYVNDGNRIQKFEASGALIEEVALPGILPGFLAVDSAGNIYAAAIGQLRKYSSSGSLLDARPASNIGALAVDAENELYASDLNSGQFGISRYSAAGALERVFYSEAGTRATAIAPTKDNDGVFAIEGAVVNLVSLPPPGPVVHPHPSSVFADAITNVKATLHSEVNPEGKATSFHFEYVEQEAFENEGGWAGPSVHETAESASIGSDFTLHQATMQLTELNPETLYRSRLVAANADGEAPGPVATFETDESVKFGALWAADVGIEDAILNAQINPFGFDSSGYFEYIDDAAFQSSGFATAVKVPTAPIDFAGGEEFVEGSAPVSGLAPGTLYHYRLVVTNNCKPAEPSLVCAFNSPERTFTTSEVAAPSPCLVNEELRGSSGRFLLDCRAYEMVSPIQKNGVNIEVVFNNPGYRAGLDQSRVDGNGISYSAYRAFEDPAGSPYTSQYLAERSGEGWSTDPIALPKEGPSFYAVSAFDYQIKAFTDDLCLSWALQDTPLLLAPGAVSGLPNLYKRKNCEPETGSYESITKVVPIGSSIEPNLFFPELVGFSADTSRTFFRVPAKLTSDSREDLRQVYEVTSDAIQPVCVLPEGSVTAVGCALGTGSPFGNERNANVATAVSEDGSTLYWTDSPTGPGPLYVRVNGSETVAVSAQASQFWAAAPDGSRAIYTVGEKLFEFNLATKTSTQITDGVKGLAGASEDLSRLYMVSTKALTGEATAGALNLFSYSAGSFQFIGELAANDNLSNRPSPIATRAFLRTARVTPDGEHLVFMSRAALTGYENVDLVSDERVAEVFLYSAGANSGSGVLVCLSCNPTGARPVGREWRLPPNPIERVAAWIPGWTTQLYASRVISDDGGRVFFNSFDSLVARDENGVQDVYQWEAPGAGNCEVGGYAYVEVAAGCLNLVSSGQSPEASEFVDASSSGHDVFFKTSESLVPQDPGLLDIYDARVEGGLPSPPPPPPDPPCEDEECMGKAGSEPDHPTPQSTTFVGPGNVIEKGKTKKCPKGKHRAKRNGKVVCRKGKKTHRHRRSGK